MAKVALRFGCAKQSKNLEWYLLYKYWHGFSKAHDKGILSAKSGQVLLASCEGNGDFVSDGARTRPKPCLLNVNTLLKFYQNTVIIFNIHKLQTLQEEVGR